MAFVVLEDALSMKGYLPKVSYISRCSLLWNVKKSVARSCHGLRGCLWVIWVLLPELLCCWVQMVYLFM